MAIKLKKYEFVLGDDSNNVNYIKNEPVTVRLNGSLATIYSDPLGDQPIHQPGLTTGSNGLCTFYAEPSNYEVVTQSGLALGCLSSNIDEDSFGFHQAILSAAGIVPTGNPDQVGASQHLDSLIKLFRTSGVTAIFASSADLSDRKSISGLKISLSVGMQVAVSGENGEIVFYEIAGGSGDIDIGNGLFADAIKTHAESLVSPELTRNGVTDDFPASSPLVEALRRNYKYALRYPSNFETNHILPIPIYFKGGRYFTDYDPRNLKPVRTNTFYVDPVNGSDTNPGSEASPFATLHHALSQAGDNEIVLKGGEYYYNQGWKGEDPARGVSVVCPDGVATLNNEAYPREWTEDSAVQGVYVADTVSLGEDLSAVRADIRFIVKDRASDTARGFQLQSKSVAQIDAGEVGFAIGVTSTRVRLPSNENPNIKLKISYALANVLVQSNTLQADVIYLENITTLYGSPNSARFDTSNDLSKVVLINCDFNNGHADDTLEINGTGLSVLYRTKANGAYKDGFNYQTNFAISGSTKHDILEIECSSRNNGIVASGSNNGSTIHGTCNVIRLNCDHSYNQNRNVHDVGASRSFNVGCRAEGSETFMSGFESGLSNGVEQTQMWLIGCKSDKTRVELNSLIYLSDDTVEFELTNGGGSVFNYNP